MYTDLKTAQKHLILIDNLHLLYLVTPYNSISQITPVGSIYYDVVILYYLCFYALYYIFNIVHTSNAVIYLVLLFKIMELTESQMQVARLLGITEATANKLRDGIIPKVSLS